MFILRNFVIGRLIFMMLPFAPGPLVIFRPILDLFGAKRFDVSFNIMPFPVTLYSGTVIQAGILLDIERVSFFGIPLIRKAYFHLVPFPFKLEAHLFIVGGGVQAS